MARKTTKKKTKGSGKSPTGAGDSTDPMATAPGAPTQLSASVEEAKGRYTNNALIHHTEREYVFDFVWTLQEQNFLVARIITSPQHAKQIHDALGRNLKLFEEKFGVIEL